MIKARAVASIRKEATALLFILTIKRLVGPQLLLYQRGSYPNQSGVDSVYYHVISIDHKKTLTVKPNSTIEK
ncbi:hypothetical protein [Lactiplantibacillus pentosus]|nr:hypothetical protein [Lactiplantibacillus pentosus]